MNAMRFFDKFLKRYPKPEEWADISQRIAEGFFNSRKEWFCDICFRLLRDQLEMEFVAELPSDVELVLKAYQLASVSGFLGNQNYLPKSESQNFCDLFWAQVGGTELPRICEIVRQFWKVVPEARDFHLARRMIESMVTGKVTAVEIAVLTATVRAYSLLNCAAVAKAFGDMETVAKLHKGMEDWVANFPDNLQKIVNAFQGSANAA
jgi:hypothetical protein